MAAESSIRRGRASGYVPARPAAQSDQSVANRTAACARVRGSTTETACPFGRRRSGHPKMPRRTAVDDVPSRSHTRVGSSRVYRPGASLSFPRNPTHWWAQLVGAPRVHPHKHWGDYSSAISSMSCKCPARCGYSPRSSDPNETVTNQRSCEMNESISRYVASRFDRKK